MPGSTVVAGKTIVTAEVTKISAETETAANAATPPVRKRRPLLLAVAGIVLAVVVILPLLLMLLFSREADFSMVAVGEQDINNATRIANRILGQIMQAGNDRQTAELILTPTEVNSLIKVGSNAKNLRDILLGRPLDIVKHPWSVVYQDGKFIVRYCADTKQWTPFGSKINFYLQAVPRIEPQTEEIILLQLKAGALRLPAAIVETRLRQELAKQRQKPSYQLLRQIIVSTQITPSGSIIIKYHPGRLRQFIPKLF